MTELLSCPFCGSTNCSLSMRVGAWKFAYCPDCLTEGPAMDNDSDAIAAWNRRAPSKVQAEAVRAMCVPPEVTAALDRMCTPLDPSVLTGATASADAHSMQVIQNYILETARSGWISIGERMPEPDEPVLVHNGRWTGVGAWMSGEYLEDIERWQDEHREFIEMNGPAVTHWMPLPEAPDAAAASGGEKV